MARFLKEHLPGVIGVFICFFLIPQFMMAQPDYALLWDRGPEGLGLIINAFLWSVWVLVPLSGMLMGLMYVLANREFPALLGLEAALCACTWLFRMPWDLTLVLGLSIPLMLATGAFGKLARFEASDNFLLKGFAQNRKFLTLLWFWSVGILSILQIASHFTSRFNYYIHPLFLIPGCLLLTLALIVLPVFQAGEHPTTLSGLLGTIGIALVAAVLCVIFYLNRVSQEMIFYYWLPGFGILTLIQTGIWLVSTLREGLRKQNP